MPKVKKKVSLAKVGWKKHKGGFSYYFKATVKKRFKIGKIEFVGFTERPTKLSLYGTGGGFNKMQSKKIGGDFFLNYLSERYKREINLNIYENNISPSIKVLKQTISLHIFYNDFLDILKDLGDEIKNNKNLVIQKRLAKHFTNEFKIIDEGQTTNTRLTEINLNNLNNIDHEAIGDFIKRYISLNADNNKILEKLQTDLVIQGRKKTLDEVIKRFEKHLKNKAFDEKKWQIFLHTEVFYFISNYIESIREANVNFGKMDEGEKKPDFVWIDIYGFLDVFEIKTPHTDILAKRIDKSHKNYFFSSHAAKAISQIEKYILFLEKNVEKFEKYLSNQTKIPFSVLKPKAFLIIGSSKELETNPTKKRDFRLLRRLFKNIEFITFDELLDNLKSLSNKFEKINK